MTSAPAVARGALGGWSPSMTPSSRPTTLAEARAAGDGDESSSDKNDSSSDAWVVLLVLLLAAIACCGCAFAIIQKRKKDAQKVSYDEFLSDFGIKSVPMTENRRGSGSATQPYQQMEDEPPKASIATKAEKPKGDTEESGDTSKTDDKEKNDSKEKTDGKDADADGEKNKGEEGTGEKGDVVPKKPTPPAEDPDV